MSQRGKHAGAAAVVLGLWLSGPAGLAVADAPDDANAPASAGSRADATRPGAARTDAGPREDRATRTPRAAAASGAKSAERTRESSTLPVVLPSASTSDTEAPDTEAPDTDNAIVIASDTDPTPVAITTAAPPVSPYAPAPVAAPVTPVASVTDTINAGTVRAIQFIDSVGNWLSGLPGPFGDVLSGALLLVRRTLFPGVPTLPVISVGDVTVSEGGYGDPERAVFAVTLGATYTDTVSVRYGTAGTGAADSAVPGLDYAPVSGTLVFAPGETTAQVSVAVFHDDIADGSRTFRLEIYPGATTGSLAGAILAAGTATVTDDPILTYAPSIAIPEIDSLASPLAVRVDPTQQAADGIKATAGTAFTLTLPGAANGYTVLANKPALLTIAAAGNTLTVTPKTPGFLGLSISNGTTERYLGLYIADSTGVVPDTVTGYLPLGSVTVPDDTGDKFLQDFNFREGVAPIDYLYIYDQGGPDYTDGNLRGLLTQAVRHGQVPVVVFYNIQAVLDATGSTGITEGYNSAYASINNFNYTQSGQKNPTMYTDFMKRYFQKMQRDFTLMNSVGVPVQVVVEPDFLGYMAVNTPDPRYFPASFVPNPSTLGDRTVNTAMTSDIYAAGLLVSGTDPTFANTIAGLVEAINYYTAKNMPNLRLGWKTNIWSVPDQRFYSLGLLHGTDSVTYPFQYGWGKPIGFAAGQSYITEQANLLGAFLKNVGVTSWNGSAARAPFVAIDKYGVDGLYTLDPDMLNGGQTAAFGNLGIFVTNIYANLANVTDADTLKFFGKNKADFTTFYTTRCPSNACDFKTTDPEVRAVWTAMQNTVRADPNLAMWYFNADQWNNYLLLVDTLATSLNTKVMLWQIPQGHVNGSTTLPGTDLTNVAANFEDTATSYFFGDSFVATDGKLAHLDDNEAKDSGVRVSGTTITWDEHMTKAGESGVLSVLFGAGLGISTRGTPTPAGGINDNNFWSEKATQYLRGVTG